MRNRESERAGTQPRNNPFLRATERIFSTVSVSGRFSFSIFPCFDSSSDRRIARKAFGSCQSRATAFKVCSRSKLTITAFGIPRLAITISVPLPVSSTRLKSFCLALRMVKDRFISLSLRTNLSPNDGVRYARTRLFRHVNADGDGCRMLLISQGQIYPPTDCLSGVTFHKDTAGTVNVRCGFWFPSKMP